MTAVFTPNDNAPIEVTQTQNTALIFGTFAGGALIVNSYIAAYTFEAGLPSERQIVAGLSALIGAILLAAPLISRAVTNILKGHIYIGELAALAVLACFATNKYQEAGLVAFFLLLAELLETRTALGARAAVEGLIRLTPDKAHRLIGDEEADVDVSQLRAGDRLRIRPGENVPADGILHNGETTINQASVTGESLPVDKRAGDQVFAGTVNLTGVIEVEVTQVGEDTTLGRVRELILDAERTRLPIMRMIDQYAEWYTPAIVMIAAVIWYFTGTIEAAITALVVSCPCAIVLSTPTAMVAGLTCAARLGILVKNVSHLESAGSINAVVLDKTGTLTTGELNVTRLAPAPGVEAAYLLTMAGSADRYSNHPAARALIRVANEARVNLQQPENTREVGGQGVIATVDGKTVRVGRTSWLTEEGIALDHLETPTLTEAEGYSTVYVAAEDKALGWVGMLDKARPEAQQATDDMKKLGIHTLAMVTGDRWGVAKRVAGDLGCTDVVAECLPAMKLELVEGYKREGKRVMVVGDGVNDAPALAAGDLGVAMGAAGNDIAINSASIALLSSNLDRLPFLIRLSRRVRGIITQNMIVGIVFVLGGLIAASLGTERAVYITPVMAAILHNVSSLIVIFNSARIVRFGEEINPHQPAQD